MNNSIVPDSPSGATADDRTPRTGVTQPVRDRFTPIRGYEGLYEVGDHGTVRSTTGYRANIPAWLTEYAEQTGTTVVPTRVMVATPTSNDYLKVALRKDGKQLTWHVHRLVAEAFHGPCPEGMEVRHLNGNQTDNRAANLRYGTRVENAADRMIHAGNPSSDHCNRGHLKRGANLNPSELKYGKKSCLACSRARGNVRDHAKRGITLDLQAESDRHYAAILKAGERS